MNSLMAEMIKNNFYKQIAVFYNIHSKIGNGRVVENLFPKKMNRHLLESHHF